MERIHHFLFLLQDLPGNMESFNGEPAHDDAVDECQSDAQALDGSSKDLNGLSGIYWVNLSCLSAISDVCIIYIYSHIVCQL